MTPTNTLVAGCCAHPRSAEFGLEVRFAMKQKLTITVDAD